jgi:hypothetical protein
LIEKTIERWHACLQGDFASGLDALLADDVVFYSPIVFTPQRGKALTKLYLTAAYGTFGGDGKKKSSGSGGPIPSFRYVRQVLTDPHAILEFETDVGGKHVNGVDIITCADDGRIREFKVMIRPLQAVNLMHERMREMLEKLEDLEGRS